MCGFGFGFEFGFEFGLGFELRFELGLGLCLGLGLGSESRLVLEASRLPMTIESPLSDQTIAWSVSGVDTTSKSLVRKGEEKVAAPAVGSSSSS